MKAVPPPPGSFPEILAPAGSPEALLAAVRCGANAVYLGASTFNARRNAHNFDSGALKEAASYCHARGVAVHLALNTLVREDELKSAMKVAEEACTLGLDALIVQDLGLARRIRAAAPAMPLHASTQLSCHTPAGVRFLRDSGFSRVVLAREMSREEIVACAGQGCELEVFVHGALCMCVSGQCYFSAMLGGRSGNRGACAQPCRLPFAPVRGKPCPAPPDAAALSLRDLSLWQYAEELARLDVASLKIEGRMKRPEYVAAAVSVCRAAVEGKKADDLLLNDLQSVFSRTGFTDGYYTGRRGNRMFGTRRKEDVNAAGAVLGRLARLYDKERPSIPVLLDFTAIQPEKNAILEARDEEGHCFIVEGEPPQSAVNRPLDEGRATTQLSKVGGTPFALPVIHCRIGERLALPLSQLNTMRRQALDGLLEQRAMRSPIFFDEAALPRDGVPLPKPKSTKSGHIAPLIARLSGLHQFPGVEKADAVFLPLFSPTEKLARLATDSRVGVEIPRGLFGREEEARAALRMAAQAGIRRALCGNVGAIPLAKEAGLTPVGGFGLNITNRDALEYFAGQGLKAATLSMELSFPQMAFAQALSIPVGFMVYGRQPLMLCRQCPRQAALGSCAACAGKGALVDRKGVVFPLACEAGCTELLNSTPLYWADKREDLPLLDFWLLHFSTESAQEVENILAAYQQGHTAPAAMTRGLYRRGVE